MNITHYQDNPEHRLHHFSKGKEHIEFLPEATLSKHELGQNRLLATAMPFLLLMIKLKNISTQPDVEVINATAIKELHMFEINARKVGYAPRVILAASYSLCAACDEAVLGTTWGDQGAWVQHTLLSKIHKETWGGERFYAVLNKMAEDPGNNLDVLELFYTLLSLGFEGKYFGEGKEAREELRYALFNLIKNSRGQAFLTSHDEPLSPASIDKRVLAYNEQRLIPLWHIYKIASVIFLLFLGFFNYQSYVHAVPLLTALHKIAQPTIATAMTIGGTSKMDLRAHGK